MHTSLLYSHQKKINSNLAAYYDDCSNENKVNDTLLNDSASSTRLYCFTTKNKLRTDHKIAQKDIQSRGEQTQIFVAKTCL